MNTQTVVATSRGGAFVELFVVRRFRNAAGAALAGYVIGQLIFGHVFAGQPLAIYLSALCGFVAALCGLLLFPLEAR